MSTDPSINNLLHINRDKVCTQNSSCAKKTNAVSRQRDVHGTQLHVRAQDRWMEEALGMLLTKYPEKINIKTNIRETDFQKGRDNTGETGC